MGFSRQEYWSGSPFLPPEDLLDPGIKPKSLMSLALAGRFFTTSTNFSFFGIGGWDTDLDYSEVQWFALERNQDHSVVF